jgi:preprotein translocase subunit SecA
VASGFAAFLSGFLEDSEAPYTHPNPVLRSFIHDLRQQLEKFSKLISAKPGTKDMETFVMESKQLWFSRHNEFIKAAVQERRSIDIANDLVHRCQPEQGEKPQRNAPCPCGSGRKYKKCCYMNLS